MTSPYEFYQYWVNVPDADTEQFLLRFTFLPVAEIRDLCAAQGEKINETKRRLAFEITSLVHGHAAAREAAEASQTAFAQGGAGDLDGMPSIEIARSKLEEGIGVVDLFVRSGLCATKSDARRLVSQGGAYVGKRNVADLDEVIGADAVENGIILLRAGKKRYFRVIVK
jgi:tyrosyl-tRNA synthetase